MCFWLTRCVWIIDLKWCIISLLIVSRAIAGSVWACFWSCQLSLENIPVSLARKSWRLNCREGMRGARAAAWPQVDFSGRLQTCLIRSSHGNRWQWCTWPTYVLYVHKHTLTICYCHFVQQLAGNSGGCRTSLTEMARTNRGAGGCVHCHRQAVNELSQQRLQPRPAAIVCLQ